MGMMLFELLGGSIASVGGVSTMRARQADEPLPLTDLAAQVPPQLLEVIERATHTRALFRYKTAEHFQRALGESLAADHLLREVETELKTIVARSVAGSPDQTPAQPTEPVIPGIPGETTTPSTGTESVVYNVTGEGRAINITYVDTGGIMQTEFNVALPWSKEVSLGAPAKNSASVAVVNVGRDVTCSVSVNGAQVRQRTGRGLTICTGVA